MKHLSETHIGANVEKSNGVFMSIVQPLLDPIVTFNDLIDDDDDEDAADGDGDVDDDAILRSCLAFSQDMWSWPGDLCGVSERVGHAAPTELVTHVLLQCSASLDFTLAQGLFCCVSAVGKYSFCLWFYIMCATHCCLCFVLRAL